VYSQGTALTISLFLGLVAAKFAIGTAAYFLHISDDGGFGEVLIMIAIMVAFQAQIIAFALDYQTVMIITLCSLPLALMIGSSKAALRKQSAAPEHAVME